MFKLRNLYFHHWDFYKNLCWTKSWNLYKFFLVFRDNLNQPLLYGIIFTSKDFLQTLKVSSKFQIIFLGSMLFDDSPLLSLFEQFDKIYTILVLSLSIFDSLLSITFFDAFRINADLSCFTLFHVAKYYVLFCIILYIIHYILCYVFYYIISYIIFYFILYYIIL